MYYDLFKKLSTPESNNEGEFKSSLIKSTKHRVGKNSKGLPSILINTKNNESLVGNYKGANILLRFKEKSFSELNLTFSMLGFFKKLAVIILIWSLTNSFLLVKIFPDIKN